MAVAEILVVLVTLYFVTIVYFKWSFGYWKRKKVPYRNPTIPLGNSVNPIKKLETMALRMQKHYDYFKARGEKHGGIYVYSVPIYMPFDSEYIKNILVKDFDYFVDRGMYSNPKDDPLTGNVFFSEGKRWRHIRTKLTPVFTSGKMKMMFNILSECSKQMIEEMNTEKEVNMREMIACFTTDVISSCAFGLECNSCKNPDEEFRKYGKMVLDFSRVEAARNTISTVLPNLCRSLGVRLVKKSVSDFFLNVINSTVDYREKNNVYRKDFLQLLIDLKKNGKSIENGSYGMTTTEMAAEAFAFYVGGFETSSSTMTFSFLELALNAEVQEKAREEVNKVLTRYNGEITYEALSEMTYLQQVVDETLRKYPIVPVLFRKCIKDYKIPETDVTLDKGTMIFISLLAVQRDPDNFPNPEEFNPERFSPENKLNIKPFTYMPFGTGPRNCIGLRFGIMQSKLGLATVLKNFRFTLNEKTNNPIEFNGNNFVLEPVGGIYLNLEKIDQ